MSEFDEKVCEASPELETEWDKPVQQSNFFDVFSTPYTDRELMSQQPQKTIDLTELVLMLRADIAELRAEICQLRMQLPVEASKDNEDDGEKFQF